MQTIIDQQLAIIEQAHLTGWTDKMEIQFIELGRQENLLISKK